MFLKHRNFHTSTQYTLTSSKNVSETFEQQHYFEAKYLAASKENLKAQHDNKMTMNELTVVVSRSSEQILHMVVLEFKRVSGSRIHD